MVQILNPLQVLVNTFNERFPSTEVLIVVTDIGNSQRGTGDKLLLQTFRAKDNPTKSPIVIGIDSAAPLSMLIDGVCAELALIVAETSSGYGKSDEENMRLHEDALDIIRKDLIKQMGTDNDKIVVPFFRSLGEGVQPRYTEVEKSNLVLPDNLAPNGEKKLILN